MPNKDMFKFNHIKRTAPSLNNSLCRTKYPSLGPKFGTSVACGNPICKCCIQMSGKDTVDLKVGLKRKRTKVRCGKGDCSSRNVIYLVKCKCCDKHYVGKTTQQLHSRMNQHRWCFGNFITKQGNINLQTEKDQDNYALGMHLYNEHGVRNLQQFNAMYEVSILEVTQPRIIDAREHAWIHRLKSINPLGLNLASTFGLPMLL